MEGVGASSVRIDRKSSIDSEPRTLTFDQIHFAREAARYVMKTMTIEEAMSIFTQGLEPVVSAGRCNKNNAVMIDTGEELEQEGDRLHLPGPRDIASAPF